ncbi:MAG TPA: porin family protein [Candidatus Cloacimonas sp.]|nr:PorT family protein [Candidatus Cloacimonas sp.]MDD2249715.1 porin family protein [Candidatus Cloacimonadota bacterium]MCK9164235.1 PorT family protein [Candidatus Cloacimonas sp.]MDD3733685.1 porin family protein [Candidatus Cloacimonadota bacterium]MDD3869842.1 porin family protein [Candidatus Cloacimonadota bacterium]
MKAILTIAFVLFCICLSAVDYIDVVYTKNGDVLKGIIIENIPNDKIKVDINGVVVTVMYDQIIKLAKEEIDTTSTKVTKRNAISKTVNENDSDLPFHKKYGLLGGVNSATAKVDNSEGVDISSVWGFSFGGFATFQTSPNIIIQPELIYTGKGFKTEINLDDYDYEYKETDEWKFAYLEVPVLFKYVFQTGNMYITPFIGPSLSIAMSGKVSYDSYQYYQNYEEEDSGSMDIKNQMEDIDFGLNFGTDLYFSEKIFLQLKYDLGLSKIFTKSVLESKNRVLSLSMGVSF